MLLIRKDIILSAPISGNPMNLCARARRYIDKLADCEPRTYTNTHTHVE